MNEKIQKLLARTAGSLFTFAHLFGGDGQLSLKDGGDPVAHTEHERQGEWDGKETHACRQKAVDGTVRLRLSRAGPEGLVDEHETETHCRQRPVRCTVLKKLKGAIPLTAV